MNKEGTTRYDCTELPITHFKSKEIGTPIKKLQELGYVKDIYGRELSDEDQVIELKPQDLILPGFNSLDESAPKVLLRVAQFIDELLVKFYGLEPFYNLRKEEDLVVPSGYRTWRRTSLQGWWEESSAFQKLRGC